MSAWHLPVVRGLSMVRGRDSEGGSEGVLLEDMEEEYE